MKNNRKVYEMQRQLVWNARQSLVSALESLETAQAINKEEGLEQRFADLHQRFLSLDLPVHDLIRLLDQTAPAKPGEAGKKLPPGKLDGLTEAPL